MEAIAELFGAIIAGVFGVLIAVVQVVSSILAILFEFLFILITGGVAAAKDRYRGRTQKSVPPESEATPQQVSADEPPIQPTLISVAAMGLVLMLIVGLVIGGLFIRERINQRRIAKTKVQLEVVADNILKALQGQNVPDPQPGPLLDRDLWRQPLELFIDKTLMGQIVVIRSAGPDKETGTIDDILSIHILAAGPKQIGGNLAKRGMNAVKDRVKKFLEDHDRDKGDQEPDGKPQDELPP